MWIVEFGFPPEPSMRMKFECILAYRTYNDGVWLTAAVMTTSVRLQGDFKSVTNVAHCSGYWLCALIYEYI